MEKPNTINNMDAGGIITISDGVGKILPICFYRHDDDNELISLSQNLFLKLGLTVNYSCSSRVSYMTRGDIINLTIKNLLDKVDYFLFFDIYTVIYKNDFYANIYSKISDKNTLYGIADREDNCDMEYLPKIKPTKNVYTNFGCFAFSSDLYRSLVYPPLDKYLRCAEGEELSWRVQELGYQTNFLYPSKNYDLTEEESKQYNIPIKSPISNGSYKSLAAEYNNRLFHLFEPKVSRGMKMLKDKYLEIINSEK